MSSDTRATAQPVRRRPLRRWLLRGGAAIVLVSVLYFVTLLHPRMFFAWARDGASIHVRSDEPIPESAAGVISLAETKIRRSTLFDATRTYAVYVCDARWRWNYFSGFNGRSRGFQTPLLSVFLDGTALRHLGLEDPTVTSFSEETDVNGIVWERFTVQEQLSEIQRHWPDAALPA
jgi:hypothetical protein